MEKDQTQLLQDFIACHGLRRPEGPVLFDAIVSYYKEGALHHIQSQVLIITLPKETALYILEFIQEGRRQREIYSTKDFHFSHTAGSNTLEIRDGTDSTLFLISVGPLN